LPWGAFLLYEHGSDALCEFSNGVYKDGKIFAIIAEGGLYFKADEKTADFFRERGSRRFTYTKKNGKKFAMNYWFVSEEVLENREAFAEWVDVAFSVK